MTDLVDAEKLARRVLAEDKKFQSVTERGVPVAWISPEKVELAEAVVAFAEAGRAALDVREANGKPDYDKVSALVWEVANGWAYAVYFGDGAKPGSLQYAGAALGSADTAWRHAVHSIDRIRERKASA